MLCPPQEIRFFDAEGTFHLRPFIYDLVEDESAGEWERSYVENTKRKHPLYLFASGPSYTMWGIFTSDIHLFGTESEAPLFLFGTDDLGRDLFTRICYGARISLTIGLIGVALTFFIGILLGGIAGYYSGWLDVLIQRAIEILMAIPQLPLWMALSAALPAHWPPLRVYFGVTIILSLMGWTGLARVVRGALPVFKGRGFCGCCSGFWNGRNKNNIHPPSALLSQPYYNVCYTRSSGHDFGRDSPKFSRYWPARTSGKLGCTTAKAQNFQAVAMAPWLLLPGLFVVLAVLAFNVVGDGMRDAADPYASK